MATNINALTRDLQRIAIDGVKRIYNATDAPVELFTRDCPALVPDIGAWLESSVSTRKTSRNVNVGGMWHRERTWNYTMFHSEAGDGRKPGAAMGTLADLVDATENALCDWVPAGAMEIVNVSIGRVGIVRDASDKQFIGFPVTFVTRETY